MGQPIYLKTNRVIAHIQSDYSKYLTSPRTFDSKVFANAVAYCTYIFNLIIIIVSRAITKAIAPISPSDYLKYSTQPENLIPEPLPKLLLLYLQSDYLKYPTQPEKNLIPEPLPKLLLLYLQSD